MSDLVVFTKEAQRRDIGDFEVNRVLPSIKRKMVGPFIFVDHMGPVKFNDSQGIDVRPHPHIGLATITFLFEGQFLHEDSLASKQEINPGDVNWMVAGKGIVHSERTPQHMRKNDNGLHGIQTWVCLPKEHEQTQPMFQHFKKDAIPNFTLNGVVFDLIAGEAFGHQSPVKTFSPMFYLNCKMDQGSDIELTSDMGQRAIYVVDGVIDVDNQSFEKETMVVFKDDEDISLSSAEGAHLMLFGGQKLTEDRIIWWNFVATSQELIEEAKIKWKNQEFGKIEGDDEFIPLPEK